MNDSQTVTNKYYIFISYSRKDSKAAAYLQRQLEHFRIPAKLVPKELLPEGQSFIRPVFRDKRDLKNSETSFTKDIEAALDASRYLLVLCSPNAASSQWVNEEVRHFRTTQNGDYSRIVPIILEGRPGCSGADECLPPELRCTEITSRNLPTMIPDDGDSIKAGWENGLVQALSFMLKVDREKIKASVDRERMRLLRLNVIVACCAAVIFALLTVWALHAERVAEQNRRQAVANEAEAKANAELARKKEAEAKEQTVIAQKTSDFLYDIFRFSDPSVISIKTPDTIGNKEIKLLEAIMLKLPEIPKLEPWQLRASLSLQMSKILIELAEYKMALPLTKDAVKLYEEHNPKSKNTATAYNNLGLIYKKNGQYDDALNSYNKALEIAMVPINDEDKSDSVALTYNNIGGVYLDQGKLNDALFLFQKALEIYMSSPNKNHGGIEMCYNNIGEVYRHQGKEDEALKNYNMALDYLEQFDGNNAISATLYDNIGQLYVQQEKFDIAFDYFHKALNTRLKLLGENHSATLVTYGNIASLYERQGKYKDALKYLDIALEKHLKYYGENTGTGILYNNIGGVYCELKKYDDALKAFNKALEIFKISLKPLVDNHPIFATSYNNIGRVYLEQDRFDEASQNFTKALNIGLKLNDGKHIVADSYKRLGLLFMRQNKLDEALKSFQKRLEICLNVLGEKHLENATNYHAIGMIYIKQNKPNEALLPLQKALEIYLNVPGENHHRDIVSCTDGIAMIFISQGNYAEALVPLQKSLETRLKFLDENHSEFLTNYILLAVALRKLGKLDKALEYASKAVEIAEKTLGKEHPNTKQILNNLNEIKAEMEKK